MRQKIQVSGLVIFSRNILIDFTDVYFAR